MRASFRLGSMFLMACSAPLLAQNEPVAAEPVATITEAEALPPVDQPGVTAEQAMEKYRAMTTLAKPGCGTVGAGDEIVVCADTDYAATQKLPFPRLAGVGQSRENGVRDQPPKSGSLLNGIYLAARLLVLVDPPLATGDYQQEDIDSQAGGLNLD